MMNYFYLTGGLFAFIATLGHFTMGKQSFLNPVLASDVALVPKNVMIGLFHYMSVYLVLTTLVLISFSFGKTVWFQEAFELSFFIGISYAGFAIVQLIIALGSSLKRGVLKLFQWVFWILIALFAFLGNSLG